MSIFKSIWNHKIRSIIILAGIAITAVIVYQVTRPPKTTSTKVIRGSIHEVVDASGKILAKESATLTFPAASKIVWIGVKEGDQVKKYQSVASVDRRELEKSIQSKMLDYMTARWNHEQVSDDHDVNGRSLDLVGLTTEERRIVEKSQFGLDQSVLDYEITHLSLEQSSLVSPITGTVIDTSNVLPGERLSAAEVSTRPIRIVNLKSLYYQAEVDEVDYAKVKTGMKAQISLDSFSDATISGTVSYIGKEGIKKTGGGIQVMIDITLDPTNLNLIPELTGDVSIITNQKENVLTLDKKYVTKKDGKYTVQVMQNGKLQSKDVQVGMTNTKTVEITQGLSESDEVVILAK